MTSMRADGEVQFKFFRPNASSVTLVGEFNGWQKGDLPMEALGDGWWTIGLELAPGEYRFRYFADGEWHTDYAANGVEKCKWGWNSILVVPADQRGQRDQDTELKIAA